MHFRTLAAVFVVATAAAAPAMAADEINWTGFFLGGHLGMLSSTTSFNDPNGPPIYGGSVTAGGALAGFQAGYNQRVAPQWVLGIEGEYSFLGGSGSNTCLQPSTTVTGSNCKVQPQELATLAGRVGFLTQPQGRTMLFGKAGVSWLRSSVSMNPATVSFLDPGYIAQGITFSDDPNQPAPTSGSIGAFGPTIGAGVEYAFSPRWSMKFEYDYHHFSGMSLVTPQVTDVSETGVVTNLGSGGSSAMTQNLHIAKVGLNYRFGGPAKDTPASLSSAAADEPPFVPGWEFDVGTRFWYSSGRYQNQNGSPNQLVSRLTYRDVIGQSGELFARADAPFGVFVKGFVGAGGLSKGKMYDEDWGLNSELGAVPTGFEVTESDLNGTLHYITGDIGYNVMRGRDHKVGVFVGYNRYETTMNAMGCDQLVATSSGVCSQPPIPPTTNGISQIDAWQSVRVGVSAEATIFDRLKIAGDFAWLPYVKYDGLDIHRVRNIFFPVQGYGKGVQAELILTYMATEKFGIGIGGRYWSMWSSYAYETSTPTNIFEVETDRYGVFLQASYKFMAPR
ncbi:MAG: porin family protein [Reyranella sp.]|nr:MAG: porin family protein [Reyranella sp.]